MRLTFNILEDIEESIRREIKKGARRKHSSGEKQDSSFMTQKTEAISGTDSGSNPCPLLHSHRSNPLRYRHLLLLSLELATYEKYRSIAFSLACFFLSCVLNEQKKTFAAQSLKHGRVGCMLKDR